MIRLVVEVHSPSDVTISEDVLQFMPDLDERMDELGIEVEA